MPFVEASAVRIDDTSTNIMKETLSTMSKANTEAPLAQFEDADEWQYGDYRTKAIGGVEHNEKIVNKIHLADEVVDTSSEGDGPFAVDEEDEHFDDEFKMKTYPKALSDMTSNNAAGDHFHETVSGSLEDLVNTFDEKITRCFCDYQESVEKLAPVQVRSQEEIMNECQMWWTITGNFGNILPIDWTKSYSCKVHVPALNLKRSKDENEEKSTLDDNENEKNGGGGGGGGGNYYDLANEDEAIAHDLDMHSLILSGLNVDSEPVKTAEEVIREINELIEEETCECPSDVDTRGNDLCRKKKETLLSPLYHEKLKTLSVSQLNESYLELELLIKNYSETLISELALRDELEFEKELKNSFISLLLGVQNRRRQYYVEKKKGIRNGGVKSHLTEPKYLTTVIPYHADNGPLDNQALQILMKILKAINEDSPTVPTLLTDYILKVLCPT